MIEQISSILNHNEIPLYKREGLVDKALKVSINILSFFQLHAERFSNLDQTDDETI